MPANVPVGMWNARAISAALSYAKTGKEQVVVSFAILDGPGEGQQIRWTGWFTDKTFERTIRSLRYCGWKGDDLSDLSTVGELDCQVTVEHESYEGKSHAKVAWVNALGGNLKSMATVDAAGFASRMLPRIAALKSEGPTEDDGEVPF